MNINIESKEYFYITNEQFIDYRQHANIRYKTKKIIMDNTAVSGYRVYPIGICTSLITFKSAVDMLLEK